MHLVVLICVMLKVGFVGGGRMAQALIKGFISAGLTKGNNVIASCAPGDEVSIRGLKELDVAINFNNKEIVQSSEVTVLAVKPQVMPEVLNDIKSSVTPKHLLLSVAMGITVKQLETELPNNSRVIRIMPNVASLVKKSASVYTVGSNATQSDAEITEQLFNAVGTCHKVPEYLFDPATALSGSGPAYVCIVIEAMADGAVREGMPRDLAYKLAAQTVLGAATLVLNENIHPAVLKDNVSSPAGSTCEGLYRLEEGGIRAAFIKAIHSATARCRKTSNS
uniref:Pyrroline-5-carboxylate reductase n=1 Tax=Triatoma infestans TaxID=30076 RepID=A0A170YTU3_TRIIF